MKPPAGSLHGLPPSLQLVSVTPEPVRPLTPDLSLSIDVLTLLLGLCEHIPLVLKDLMMPVFFLMHKLYTCVCCVHTGANPLQVNGLGHTARAYAKEGNVSAALQEWESKV